MDAGRSLSVNSDDAATGCAGLRRGHREAQLDVVATARAVPTVGCGR